MKRITITLSPQWVLEKADGGQIPSEVISGFVVSHNWGTVVECDFTEIVIASDKITSENLKEVKFELVSFLAEQMREKIDALSEQIEVEIEQSNAEEIPDDPPKEAKPEKISGSRRREELKVDVEKKVGSALDKIRVLRGAGQFVSVCEEISGMAPVLCGRNLQSVLVSVNYIFSVDPGCGHSTALRLFSELLSESNLMKLREDPVEMKVSAGNGRENPLEDAAAKLSRYKDRVISVDISDWSDKVSSPEFRDFLLALQNNTYRAVYVFRLPYLEHSALSHIEEAISDVMRVRTISFVPPTAEALQLISQDSLREKGFSATEDAWEKFYQRLAEEKSDGRFYGIKTAEKIVEEMVCLKIRSMLQGDSTEDDCIEGRELSELVSIDEDSESAEDQLNKMIGIDAVRQKIGEIIAQIEFARKTPGISAPAMHMRFVGNPGTGKTTVARLIGQLLKEKGVLSKGYFFEQSGGDFIGMYVGHTAPKTMAICRDAYGSVLFIDEAYTLSDADYNTGNGYAREAIDTLIAQMENHRDDMVVIMAGYPDEMNTLMRMNPGLEGRMPYVLEFPNYSRPELAEIFAVMAEQSSFSLAPDVQEQVDAYFAALDDSVINAPEFSNARFVRNIFEQTWSKTITRAQIDGSDVNTITKEDFAAAISDSSKAMTAKQTKRSKPGYRLGLI